MGRDPIEEMQFFWIPEMIFAKMLFRFEGTFFCPAAERRGSSTLLGFRYCDPAIALNRERID